MQPKKFTKPKVLIPKDPSKDWLVWFRYDGKLKRYKKGINYIHNLKERLIEANALAEALWQKLKEDWNPNNPFQDSEKKEENALTGLKLTLSEALDFAIAEKTPNLAPKTNAGYQCTVRFCKVAIQKLGLVSLLIQDTKRIHIKQILSSVKKDRNLTNNAYNQHLGFLQAVLSELLDWEIIEFNPAHKIKKLTVDQHESNIPATPAQRNLIKKTLLESHPYYQVFIETIYHTGIRPEELVQVKLQMINFEKNEIRLPPNITKRPKERIVPINPHLYKSLIEFLQNQYFEQKTNSFPEDFYLFGSHRTPGRGNVGHQKDFIPGPTQIKRDTATRRWKKVVKDGLGINVNMYAEKHAGADAKILAGIPLEALSELYGHSSKFITEKYARKVKEVYRNKIIELSPAY